MSQNEKPGFQMPQPIDIDLMRREGRCRWLRGPEIYRLLHNFRRSGLSAVEDVVQRPEPGTWFLYTATARVRQDGFTYAKRNRNGYPVLAESHVHLQLASRRVLSCYYCTLEEHPTVQRRIYWLLEGEFELRGGGLTGADQACKGVAFVHYLDDAVAKATAASLASQALSASSIASSSQVPSLFPPHRSNSSIGDTAPSGSQAPALYSLRNRTGSKRKEATEHESSGMAEHSLPTMRAAAPVAHEMTDASTNTEQTAVHTGQVGQVNLKAGDEVERGALVHTVYRSPSKRRAMSTSVTSAGEEELGAFTSANAVGTWPSLSTWQPTCSLPPPDLASIDSMPLMLSTVHSDCQSGQTSDQVMLHDVHVDSPSRPAHARLITNSSHVPSSETGFEACMDIGLYDDLGMGIGAETEWPLLPQAGQVEVGASGWGWGADTRLGIEGMGEESLDDIEALIQGPMERSGGTIGAGGGPHTGVEYDYVEVVDVDGSGFRSEDEESDDGESKFSEHEYPVDASGLSLEHETDRLLQKVAHQLATLDSAAINQGGLVTDALLERDREKSSDFKNTGSRVTAGLALSDSRVGSSAGSTTGAGDAATATCASAERGSVSGSQAFGSRSSSLSQEALLPLGSRLPGSVHGGGGGGTAFSVENGLQATKSGRSDLRAEARLVCAADPTTGATLLHLAVQAGSAHLAALLLKSGAANVQNARGETPAAMAHASGQADLIALFSGPSRNHTYPRRVPAQAQVCASVQTEGSLDRYVNMPAQRSRSLSAASLALPVAGLSPAHTRAQDNWQSSQSMGMTPTDRAVLVDAFSALSLRDRCAVAFALRLDEDGGGSGCSSGNTPTAASATSGGGASSSASFAGASGTLNSGPSASAPGLLASATAVPESDARSVQMAMSLMSARDLLELEVEARRIQCGVRTWLTRRNYLHTRTATRTLQAAIRRMLARRGRPGGPGSVEDAKGTKSQRTFSASVPVMVHNGAPCLSHGPTLPAVPSPASAPPIVLQAHMIAAGAVSGSGGSATDGVGLECLASGSGGGFDHELECSRQQAAAGFVIARALKRWYVPSDESSIPAGTASIA